MDEQQAMDRRAAGPEEGALASASPRVPPELTTPHAKLVYLYLWLERRADVGEMSAALGLPQIRLYPVLAYLVRSGHVARAGPVYSLDRPTSGAT